MVRYRLVLTPTQKGSFIAVVPDMPRFCATGRIQAEVASHAADALRLRVKAVMRKDQISQGSDFQTGPSARAW